MFTNKQLMDVLDRSVEVKFILPTEKIMALVNSMRELTFTSSAANLIWSTAVDRLARTAKDCDNPVMFIRLHHYCCIAMAEAYMVDWRAEQHNNK